MAGKNLSQSFDGWKIRLGDGCSSYKMTTKPIETIIYFVFIRGKDGGETEDASSVRILLSRCAFFAVTVNDDYFTFGTPISHDHDILLAYPVRRRCESHVIRAILRRRAMRRSHQRVSRSSRSRLSSQHEDFWPPISWRSVCLHAHHYESIENRSRDRKDTARIWQRQTL